MRAIISITLVILMVAGIARLVSLSRVSTYSRAGSAFIHKGDGKGGFTKYIDPSDNILYSLLEGEEGC